MILLRSLLFNVLYYGALALVCLYGIVFSRTQDQAMELGRFWARNMVAAARGLCGIRLEVTGREHLPPSGPMLLACQHQSAYDTIVWQVLVPRATYVMKRELMEVPLFGILSHRAGMIGVDRAGGAAALRALLEDTDKAVFFKRQIVIFPEGTRSAPGTVGTLYPGVAAMARRSGLPIIPVRTNSGLCWGRGSFRRLPGVVHMEICPPLPADLTRAKLMAALEDAFRR